MAAAGRGAERRVITLLAVDIVNSTVHIAAADPEDAQEFFDRCFAHLKRSVERAGGRLVSYEGDGGIAAFGWPLAFEDHADRACAAAWDIQHGRHEAGPDGRPARFRVGVHSGLTAVRHFRRGDRSRLNTVGAAVHVAAKLQQCAPPGEILVSAQAARLCRSSVELKPSDGKVIVGDATIEALRLAARPESLGTTNFTQRYGAPLIGRADELATLRRCLAIAAGQASSIALIGEAGIGKSRLAATALGEIEPDAARVLVFRGDAHRRSTSFAAARALIGDLLADRSSEDRAAVLRSSRLEPAEADALEVLIAERPGRSRQGAGRLTQTQLARALVKLFIALMEARPTVILIEDLHLLDSESRQFLALLAATRPQPPLRLVLTGRPEAIDDARGIAEALVRLDPLPRDEMKKLAHQLWPEDHRNASVLDRVVDRADGIPFVLEELIHALASGEVSGIHALPQSVSSVIHARLHHLSPPARALVQALSLLEENAEPELVATMMGETVAGLRERFLELERFAFTHPLTGETTRLRHQIIAEACAETIPRDQRRDLHRRAGAAIRAVYGAAAGRFEQLAFHAEAASDLTDALDYLFQAAGEARRNAAAASLNALFDRAMGIIERVGDSAQQRYVDFVLMAFALLVQLGEFEKVNRYLPRVMELVRATGRPDLVGSALSQLGMICWFEGRYEEGVRASEEALAIANELKSPALVFSSTIMLTNILHDMGRVERAIAEERKLCDLLTGELETARLGATGIPRATALAFMSWFVVEVGRYDEGLDLALHALELAVREADPYAEVLARNALGRTLVYLERNFEAAECFAAARRICDRDGYDAIKAHLAGRAATALSRLGRSDEAISLVENCLRQGYHRRTGQLEVFCLHAGYAEALAARGDLERALEELAEAIALARRIASPCMLVEALGLRSRILAAARPSDPAIAEDLAEQARLCADHGIFAWSPRGA